MSSLRRDIQEHDGHSCWNRERTECGTIQGTFRPCQLESCTGLRIAIRWPDNTITWPCSEGISLPSDADWQIK